MKNKIIIEGAGMAAVIASGLILIGVAAATRPTISPKAASAQPAKLMVRALVATNAPAPGQTVFTNMVQISPLYAGTNYVFIIQRQTNFNGSVWCDMVTFNNTNTPPFWMDTNAPANAGYRGAIVPMAITNNPDQP